MIAKGSNELIAYVGGTEVAKMYKGSTLVYEKKGGSILPSGYKECDYILVCGNYIDTGLKAKPTTSVFMSCYMPEVRNQSRIFATRYGFGFQIYINGSGQWAYVFNDSTIQWTSTGVAATTGYHTFLLDGQNRRLLIDDGNTANIDLSAKTATKTSTRNFHLFYDSGNSSYRSYFLCFGGWIKEDGVFLRKYVPAREVSTGEYGLYDTVGKNFYKSATAYGFSGREKVELPEGYTKVLCVTSEKNKQNVLDSNISYSTSYKIINDSSITTLGNMMYYWGMSGKSLGSTTRDMNTAIYTRTNDTKIAFQYGDVGIWVNTNVSSDLGAHTLLMDSVEKVIKIDNGYKYNGSLADYQIGEEWYDFEFHPIGHHSTQYTPNLRTYYEELTQDGVMVARYFPCVDGNGTYGLYNIINDTFITSVNEYPLGGELYNVTL